MNKALLDHLGDEFARFGLRAFLSFRQYVRATPEERTLFLDRALDRLRNWTEHPPYVAITGKQYPLILN